MTIRKAVIAVAGFGTRFLPATKVLPKELIPIVDKPIVQYLVEEAVASGIKDIILVTRPGSQGIADHFDSTRELEIHLLANLGQISLMAGQQIVDNHDSARALLQQQANNCGADEPGSSRNDVVLHHSLAISDSRSSLVSLASQ